MEYQSDLAATSATAVSVDSPAQNQRRHIRQKIRSLAYVTLDSGEGGILRDIGECGIAMQALRSLHSGQQLDLRLDLPSPRLHIEAKGRIAWSDSLGQAGVEFLELPLRSRRLLKEWLFTQLLADASRAAGNDAAELLFSNSARPAIRLDHRRLASQGRGLDNPSRSLRLLWFSVSTQKFSALVDGLALACAILLFNVMSLFLTDVLPSWPITVAFVLGVSGIFVALYWLVFGVWIGITPGTRLAALACRDAMFRAGAQKEQRARFR